MRIQPAEISPNLVPPPAGLAGRIDEETAGRLAGLSPLTIADQELFVSAIGRSGLRSWMHYFPFLHSFGMAPNRPLLWEMIGDSLCIYSLRPFNGVPRLRLYLPPIPWSIEALAATEERQRAFNGDSHCIIVWADQQVAPELMRRGYRLSYCESDYIYDGNLVRASAGGAFARLRRSVNRLRSMPDLAVRDYMPEDQPACLDLLDRWRDRREEQGIPIDGYAYTRRGVENVALYGKDLCHGEVITLEDRLVAFSFGGPISPGMESIFITISDHEVVGLGYLQRHSFMSNSPETGFFNDGSDAGKSGLEQVKSSFRAIEMNHQYRAHLGEWDS
jgi:hypothetical protein